MTPIQVLCALLVPLFWGVQFIVIKAGLDTFPPLFFVGLRFSVIASMLIPFVKRPRRHEFFPIALISLFLGGLNFGLTFMGLAQGRAGLLGVAQQLSSPLTVLLAWPLLRERPAPRVMVGLLVAFGGVLLATLGSSASVVQEPVILVIGGALSMAVGNVLIKRHGPFDPLTLLAWMSLFAVPQVLAASVALENGQLAALRNASPFAWMAFFYTVILGGIAGFSLWFWLIRTCSVSQVAPFGLLQPCFAVAAGVLILHEPINVTLLAGMFLCIAGVAITQLYRAAPNRVQKVR